MDSIISTFHIDWHLIIAQAINFVVVILVLWHFALKPLGKLMDERGKTISGGLDNAKKQEELVAKASADYQALIAKANAEGMAKMKESTKNAEVKGEQIIAKAQEAAKEILATNLKQIEAEKVKMLADAKNELAELVIQVSAKVFEDGMTPKIDHAVVAESIKKLNS